MPSYHTPPSSPASVLHDSPEPLVTTVLQRSQGVPLTVNIWYYSYRAMPFGCRCTRYPGWEDGDDCIRANERTSSLDSLEPLGARIHTLNSDTSEIAVLAATEWNTSSTPHSSSGRSQTWSHSAGVVVSFAKKTGRFPYPRSPGNCLGRRYHVSRSYPWSTVGDW